MTGGRPPQDFFVAVGESAEFSKVLSAADVDRFAEISGDFDPIHVDEAHARTTRFGRRIAHGILSMALLSTVSAMISARARARGSRGTSVSLGYDRIRFLAPVFLGDTITVDYRFASIDTKRRRSSADIKVTNQNGELVAVGTHILKWVPND